MAAMHHLFKVVVIKYMGKFVPLYICIKISQMTMHKLNLSLSVTVTATIQRLDCNRFIKGEEKKDNKGEKEKWKRSKSIWQERERERRRENRGMADRNSESYKQGKCATWIERRCVLD